MHLLQTSLSLLHLMMIEKLSLIKKKKKIKLMKKCQKFIENKCPPGSSSCMLHPSRNNLTSFVRALPPFYCKNPKFHL